jgi:hypothetical protein
LSTDKVPRIEWRKAPDFAEVAEALGVPTTSVLAVTTQDGLWLVFYNQEGDPEDLLSSVMLQRGQDGILFMASTPSVHPGLWDRIKRGIEEKLQ